MLLECFLLFCIPLITLNALKQVPDSIEPASKERLTNPFRAFKSLFKNRMLNKIVFAAVLIGFCMSLNGALLFNLDGGSYRIA